METYRPIVLAELLTATSYLDRLLFAFSDLEKLHCTPRGKNQIQKLINDLNLLITKEFKDLNLNPLENSLINWSEFRKHIKDCHHLMESWAKLPLTSPKIETALINYTNLIYRNCYELHNFILESTQLEIQFPRHGMIQEEDIPSIKQDEEKNRAPLFYIDENKMRSYNDLNNKENSPLVFLQIRREEKYEQLIQKGHFFIAQKNYEEAKKQFYLARNYKETAEVLTLIAWSYSLLEDKTQAKSYCLKAIQVDSQYGPAYNDFGNYILAEGQVEESLRWFELAKRAHTYQTREYPYINAGRAYVLLKNYELALTEFSLALTIAPHHAELHDTVTKLKINLEKSSHAFNNKDTNPNTLSW